MIADTLTIRPFREQDCEPVLTLASGLGLSPWTINDFRDEVTRLDAEMLVAEADSTIAGFIVGRRVPGSEANGGLDAEIYNIGVVPELQRSGVGSRLIRRFIERCRKADVAELWLEVRAANAAAIRFYKKFGFVEYTVRPNFYRNPPDDGIVMRLKISSASSFAIFVESFQSAC